MEEYILSDDSSSPDDDDDDLDLTIVDGYEESSNADNEDDDCYMISHYSPATSWRVPIRISDVGSTYIASTTNSSINATTTMPPPTWGNNYPTSSGRNTSIHSPSVTSSTGGYVGVYPLSRALSTPSLNTSLASTVAAISTHGPPTSDGSLAKSRLDHSLQGFVDTKSPDSMTANSLARHIPADQYNTTAHLHHHPYSAAPSHVPSISMISPLHIPKLTPAQRDLIIGTRNVAVPSASSASNSSNYMAAKVNTIRTTNNTHGLSPSSSHSNINAGVKHEKSHATTSVRHAVSTPNMGLVQQYKELYDAKFRKEMPSVHSAADRMADFHRRVAGKMILFHIYHC